MRIIFTCEMTRPCGCKHVLFQPLLKCVIEARSVHSKQDNRLREGIVATGRRDDEMVCGVIKMEMVELSMVSTDRSRRVNVVVGR